MTAASVELSRIADVIRGVSFDKNESSYKPDSGYFPILRAGNINELLLLDQDLVWVPSARVSPSQLLRSNDIVICMSSGSSSIVGKSAILSHPWEGSVGAFCATIRPKCGKVEPQFLAYILKSQHFRYWASTANGANIKNIRKTELESFLIPLPPLPEQRRIVDILNHAAGIRSLRQQALDKARALIPALFVKMFGDPASNPRGWEVSPLSNIVAFVSGGTPSKSRDDYWIGDIPWVSPKDMKIPEIADAVDHISREALANTNLKLIPNDSVLIVVRGMILAHTVPVARTIAPLTINQDMKALIPNTNIIGNYLLWLLRVLHPQLLSLVSTAAHGTKKLDTELLMSLQIPVPDRKSVV